MPDSYKTIVTTGKRELKYFTKEASTFVSESSDYGTYWCTENKPILYLNTVHCKGFALSNNSKLTFIFLNLLVSLLGLVLV